MRTDFNYLAVGLECEAWRFPVGKLIFVSCGQFTAAEKTLGKSICDLVRAMPGLEPFFAEEVQDLEGLDTNILNHLRDAAGFITVLHPRGKIVRPSGSELIRASVWIEQEIAIATYIQRIEKRPLPVIAFIHKSVGREGIRDLLHLNPIEFTNEDDVLAALPARLQAWQNLPASEIRVELQATNRRYDSGHWISDLLVNLVNKSDKRIGEYTCEFKIPRGVLDHSTVSYGKVEIKSDDSRYRRFRLDETVRGTVGPQETKTLSKLEYCTACAGKDDPMVGRAIVETAVEADLWVNGRRYSDRKTIIELSSERDARENR
jgi:hypothetical protein